ncbi:MAG: hypothetical protein VX464_11725 [Pseudomonadota bacterium]|nr:hypothetical protein [Pseudomonadota bacterium]
MSDSEETGALERPEDAGKGAAGVVRRWRLELDTARKVEKDWRKRAKSTTERYRDEENGKTRKGNVAKFNILYSNVQTIIPALYGKTPVPDIRRRYRDNDPVGKIAAEVLERAVDFTLDDGVFDHAMYFAVFDRCLPGRGVTRVRYVPAFNDNDELIDETVTYESWPWDDFRRGPARKWEDVPWIAFRHWLTVPEGEAQFGEMFADIEADAHPEGVDVDGDGPDADTFKRVEVWEIWDKTEREVVFIAPRYGYKPLKVVPDPLGLKDFFPIPRPLYAIEDSCSLVPVEEYRMYRDQAQELDRLTARITRIIEVLKVRGVSDQRVSEILSIADKEDGEFVPAQDVAELVALGGLDKAIWMFPIDKIIAVLQTLYQSREAIKQTIYEITGISDILRGASVAAETATAQSIKAQWGSVRLRRSQAEVQRYARDLIRIAAEIIAEKFEIETLQRMTGVSMPREQDLYLMATQAQQAGKDPREIYGMPSWEKVAQVLRSDVLRGYRIDIETDSTIQADEEADKKARIELVNTVLAALMQGIQIAGGSKELAPVVMDSLLFMVRGFKDGRALEASLEEHMEKAIAALSQPNPAAQAAAQAQAEGEKMKMVETKAKTDAALAKSQADIQKAHLSMQASQQDAVHKQHEHQYQMAELQAEMVKMRGEAKMDRERHAMEMRKMLAEMATSVVTRQEQAPVDPYGGVQQ